MSGEREPAFDAAMVPLAVSSFYLPEGRVGLIVEAAGFEMTLEFLGGPIGVRDRVVIARRLARMVHGARPTPRLAGPPYRAEHPATLTPRPPARIRAQRLRRFLTRLGLAIGIPMATLAALLAIAWFHAPPS